MEQRKVVFQRINNKLWDGREPMRASTLICTVMTDPNTGLPVTGLTTEQEKWLEKEKNTTPGFYAPNSVFWLGNADNEPYTIRVNTKDDFILDLSNADDFLMYSVLKNMNFVTAKPSDKSQTKYQYFMYYPDEVQKAEEMIYSVRKEALKTLYAMTDLEKKEAYRLCGFKASAVSDIHIEKTLADMVNDRNISNAKRFMAHVADKLRKEKLLIYSLLDKGVLFIANGYVCLHTEDNQLGASVEDVARMLTEAKNSKLKLELLKADGYKEPALADTK